MNTKVLFKQVRHMPKDQQPKPVMVSGAASAVAGCLGM